MGVLFSTDDVARDERYDYWLYRHRHALDFDLRFLTDRHDRFRARCAVHALGAVQAAVLSYARSPVPTAGEVRRTPGFADRTDAYEIKFSLTFEHVELEQDGRRARLHPGDFAIADLTRPSSSTAGGSRARRLVSVTLPRALLPLPASRVAEITAVPVSGRRGSPALVATLLRRIAAEAGTYDPAEAARISTALVDLVATTLASRLDLRPAIPPDARRTALLQHIYAHVDQHLGSPGLTPATIADAHHISVRQLHKLFESERHTVAEWIRTRRLDRCRRDLADPALAARPVGAIAARWGFTDPTSFYRSFRAAHGTPPGEYRRLALGGRFG